METQTRVTWPPQAPLFSKPLTRSRSSRLKCELSCHRKICRHRRLAGRISSILFAEAKLAEIDREERAARALIQAMIEDTEFSDTIALTRVEALLDTILTDEASLQSAASRPPPRISSWPDRASEPGQRRVYPTISQRGTPLDQAVALN
jgi:hypothetical protein